jgi:hypothetical protein
MAGITVACSHCGTQLKLKDDSKVGKTAPCPKCKQPFVIEPLDESGDDLAFDEEDFEEAPQPKKAKSKGTDSKSSGSKKGKGKAKGKKGKKDSGGLMLPLMIGGGVLGLLLVVGGILFATGFFSGEPAPAVADNTGGSPDPDEAAMYSPPAGPEGAIAPVAMAHGDSSDSSGNAAVTPLVAANTGAAHGENYEPPGFESPPAGASLDNSGAMANNYSPPGHGEPTVGPTNSFMAVNSNTGPLTGMPMTTATPMNVPENMNPNFGNPAGPNPLPPLSSLDARPGALVAPPLEHLLPQTELVVHLNVQHLLASPWTLQLVNLARSQGNDPLLDFEKTLQLKPSQIEAVTVGVADLSRLQAAAPLMAPGFPGGPTPLSNPGFGPEPGTDGFGPGDPSPQPPTVVVVQLQQGVTVQSLAALQTAETKSAGSFSYRLVHPPAPPSGNPPGPPRQPLAFVELNPQTLLIGEEKDVQPLLAQGQPWGTAAKTRFAAADFSHHLTVATDSTNTDRTNAAAALAQVPEQFRPLMELLQNVVTISEVACDLTDAVNLQFVMHTADSDSAGKLQQEFEKLKLVASGQLLGVMIVAPGLGNALTTLLNNTQVSQADQQVAVQVSASASDIQTLTAEVQSALGQFAPGLMAGGPGNGPPGTPLAGNIGAEIILKGVEPTEFSGAPEGMQIRARMHWAATVQEQREPSLDPVVEVVLYDGDAAKIVEYRPTEKNPERRKSAPPAGSVVVDRTAVGEQPVNGILMAFHPRYPADPPPFIPAFEGQALIRIPGRSEEILIANAASAKGPVDHPLGRQLAMQMSSGEQPGGQGGASGPRLIYKEKTGLVVGTIEVVDQSGRPIPGIRLQREVQRGNQVVSFGGQLPAGAGIKVPVHADLKVSTVKFKFTDLPLPPKPSDPLKFMTEDELRRRPNAVPAGAGFPGTGYGTDEFTMPAGGAIPGSFAPQPSPTPFTFPTPPGVTPSANLYPPGMAPQQNSSSAGQPAAHGSPSGNSGSQPAAHGSPGSSSSGQPMAHGSPTGTTPSRGNPAGPAAAHGGPGSSSSSQPAAHGSPGSQPAAHGSPGSSSSSQPMAHSSPTGTTPSRGNPAGPAAAHSGPGSSSGSQPAAHGGK